MENKKGLSAIVATLIIILLVLVAVGIIWVVVRQVIQQGAETVDYNTKCLGVDLEAVAVTESATAGEYSVTLKMNSGDTIDGVKLNFFSATENSGVMEFGTTLSALDTKTNSSIITTVEDANKIEFTAYFLDTSGNEHFCSTQEFTF